MLDGYRNQGPERQDHQRPLILEMAQLRPPRPLGPPGPAVFHCSSFRGKPKSTSRWPRNGPSVYQQKSRRWSLYTVEHYSAKRRRKFTSHNAGESEDIMLSETNQTTKGRILYDSTYSRHPEKTHRNRKQNGGCQGLEGRDRRRLTGTELQFGKRKKLWTGWG